MTKRLWIACVLALAAVAVGCGPSEKKICVQAADRYEQCVTEMLGAEMAEMAHGKRKQGIEQCSGDDKTQEMYKACMPGKDCETFMNCIMDYAANHGP